MANISQSFDSTELLRQVESQIPWSSANVISKEETDLWADIPNKDIGLCTCVCARVPMCAVVVYSCGSVEYMRSAMPVTTTLFSSP